MLDEKNISNATSPAPSATTPPAITRPRREVGGASSTDELSAARLSPRSYHELDPSVDCAAMVTRTDADGTGSAGGDDATAGGITTGRGSGETSSVWLGRRRGAGGGGSTAGIEVETSSESSSPVRCPSTMASMRRYTVANRPSGRLASARRMSASSHGGTSGRRFDSGSGFASACWVRMSNTRVPTNGGAPVSIS